MRSLIVEDEQSARSRLKRLLLPYPEIEVIAEAEDGARGLELIIEKRPDLIFLDIEMPRLDGFEMLRALPEANPLPLVIFVTSYNQYALKAFEADALGYLLKPIEDHRLNSVIKRARQLLIHPEERAAERKRIRNAIGHVPRRVDHIVGRRHNRFTLLRPAEIFCFIADAGLVKAQTTAGSFQIEMTLDDLDALLGANRFFRARRSTLVNLTHVREILPALRSSYTLVLADTAKSEIHVSERQAKLLRDTVPGL